jgi:hypothetical protein
MVHVLPKVGGRAMDHSPAKAFSLPVMTTAPMSLSSSYLDSASLSSLKRGLESALSALGRLRVTVQCQTFVNGPTSLNMIGKGHTQSNTRLRSRRDDVFVHRRSG